MTKSDLKDGMIIETRCGDTHQVYKDIGRALGVFGEKGYFDMSSFRDNLTCYPSKFDITAVYVLTANTNLCDPEEFKKCKCIWRREEPKTLEERFTSLEETVKTLRNTLEDLK